MNPLVELITAWDTYTTQTASPISVQSFCDFYLNQSPKKVKESGTTSLSTELARITGRLSSINKTYLKLALKDLPDAEIEWYFLLHAVKQAGEVRKTEVISINLLLEPTTCIDILNRMIKLGLLNEKIDTTDKRARLLSITDNGLQLLNQIQSRVDDINARLHSHIDDDDKQQIIRLLTPVVQEHTGHLLNIVKKKYV